MWKWQMHWQRICRLIAYWLPRRCPDRSRNHVPRSVKYRERYGRCRGWCVIRTDGIVVVHVGARLRCRVAAPIVADLPYLRAVLETYGTVRPNLVVDRAVHEAVDRAAGEGDVPVRAHVAVDRDRRAGHPSVVVDEIGIVEHLALPGREAHGFLYRRAHRESVWIDIRRGRDDRDCRERRIHLVIHELADPHDDCASIDRNSRVLQSHGVLRTYCPVVSRHRVEPIVGRRLLWINPHRRAAGA